MMNKNSSLWSDAIYRLTRNKAAMIGGGILVALIISALLAPWIAPYSYSYQDLDLGASPPSAEHLLGTDILGRDLLSRILYGARVSLLVGFVGNTGTNCVGKTNDALFFPMSLTLQQNSCTKADLRVLW